MPVLSLLDPILRKEGMFKYLKHPLNLATMVLLLPLHALHAQTTGPRDSPKQESLKEEKRWDSPERLAALRVQLFLDKEGFGPGKIDGRWGGFSAKAAERWNGSDKEIKIEASPEEMLDPSKIKKVPFSDELLKDYEITQADKSLLGTLPGKPSEQAKLKSMPYKTLMEVVAEKFHADPGFLLEINELKSGADLEMGMTLKVPNVTEPFDISEPMTLAKEKDKPSETTGEETPIELIVLRGVRIVEVRKEGKLIHSFPISPGARDNQSPAGDWEVSVISWMPEFRWDRSMLENGRRSDNSFLLPPGPNNPVGIVWIGLSADGIGLHGTSSPDAIGRNSSHGCIRLSNWDALKLGKLVTVGVKVTIK